MKTRKLAGRTVPETATNSAFVVYDTTGKVTRFGSAPTSDIDKQAPLVNETVMEVEELFRYMYVDLSNPADPVLSQQQPMPYTVTGNVISDLPIPCQASYEGTTYDVDDGVIEIDADLPGIYEVLVSALAYITTFISVEVT